MTTYRRTLGLLQDKWTESKNEGEEGSWSRCWRGLLGRWRGLPQGKEEEFLTPREVPTPLLPSNHTSPEFGSCKPRWEGRPASRRDWWAWADDLV